MAGSAVTQRRGIFVFADLHLGREGTPGREWAVAAMRHAKAAGASVCVCAGDLVDRSAALGDAAHTAAQQVMGYAVELFDEVHFIAGNHDAHLKITVEGVVVHDSQPHEFLCAGVRVHTCAVADDEDLRRFSFPPRNRECGDAAPHLGILHSSVTGEYSRKPCLPTTREELLRCGYDAWILAHVHAPVTLSEDPFIGWVGMGEGLIFWADAATVQRLKLTPVED